MGETKFLKPQKFVMYLACESFTVCTRRPEFRKSNGGTNASLAEKVEQVGNESHILPITNFLTDITVMKLVFDQAR